MIWAILIVTCIGILLGLRLRVASVLAASLLLVVINTAFLPLLAGWSLLKVVGVVFLLLSALQCGYLVGAIVAYKSRTRSAANGAGQRPARFGDELFFGAKSAHN